MNNTKSILTSSFQAFLKAFFTILGISLALMISLFFLTSDKENDFKTTLTLLPDLEGKRKMLPPSTPVILQINCQGLVGKEEFSAENIKMQLIESRQVLKEGRVKGILLLLNTPGGGINDSDMIYRLLLDYKKKYKVPIYALAEGLCASGGMYIASAADKIHASPVSTIGSIGVMIGPFININQALSKLGIETQTLTKGTDKDMMNPFRPWKEGEDKFLDNLASYYYQRFVDIITTARPKLNKEKLINEYGAGIFNPIKAQELGYIDDGNSDYKKTMEYLLKAANIDKKKPYQIVELKIKKRWLADLIKGRSPLLNGKVKHIIQIGPQSYTETSDFFSYLYLPTYKE